MVGRPWWFRQLDGVSIVWSAKGHRLLLPGPQPLAYDADTHRVWKVREAGGAWALDDDGQRVAIAMPDGTVHVERIESHDAPLELSGAPQRVARLALSGDRLAAVTSSGAVTVWDLSRREMVASWEIGFDPAQIAWDVDGSRLTIAGAERVTICNLRTPGKT